MTWTERTAFLLCWMLAVGMVASCGGGTSALAPADAARACGQGVCVSTVAGSGEFGTADGPVQAAQFFMPHSVVVDEMSQVHVADFGANSMTRVIAADRVITLADDAVEFPHPADVAIDASGTRYVADPYGNRILKVTVEGTTSVLAGTGQPGDQDGDGASASFSLPLGVALDAAGALFVADAGNRKIRKITFPAQAGGAVALEFIPGLEHNVAAMAIEREPHGAAFTGRAAATLRAG